MNNRNDDSSGRPVATRESQNRRILPRIMILSVFLIGLLVTMIPLWDIYRSVNPLEQREIIFQDEVMYVGTRNVLFWLIVSLTGPVLLGLLYLIFRRDSKQICPCENSDARIAGWQKNLFGRFVFSLSAGAGILWLVSHMDLRWADRLASSWIGIHDLGTLFLGSLIGPLALVAILFLVVMLGIVWISTSPDEPNSIDNSNPAENQEGKIQ